MWAYLFSKCSSCHKSGDENYCLLCSPEKSSSRILSRVTENWAILVVNGEKQFSSRRELLDSLLEFSNSRRNLDENCCIRGENLQILVSPTIWFEAHLPVEKPHNANLEGVVGQVPLFNRLLSARRRMLSFCRESGRCRFASLHPSAFCSSAVHCKVLRCIV